MQIEGAMFRGDSMHPQPCTDADDLFRRSATVRNLGERGEPDILTQALRFFVCARKAHRTSILNMNPGNCAGRESGSGTL